MNARRAPDCVSHNTVRGRLELHLGEHSACFRTVKIAGHITSLLGCSQGPTPASARAPHAHGLPGPLRALLVRCHWALGLPLGDWYRNTARRFAIQNPDCRPLSFWLGFEAVAVPGTAEITPIAEGNRPVSAAVATVPSCETCTAEPKPLSMDCRLGVFFHVRELPKPGNLPRKRG